jgi:hypothetical protein
MLETAVANEQRPRADKPSPSRATDETRRDEANPSPTVPGTLDPPAEPRMKRIARRAHEIYEARGGVDGKALEDWLQAEREIDSELSDGGGSNPASPKTTSTPHT